MAQRKTRRAAMWMAALWLGGAPAFAKTTAFAEISVPETPPEPAAASAPVCTGRDLLADLTPDQRAAIDASVAATPYARGIRYRATKGGARIEIVGTYHFDDARHDALVAALTPEIAEAATLLVEAGPDEEKRLTAALAADPTLMVDPNGPTLPERLSDEEWAKLSAAMSDRGMPALMVSRLRPWYVSMMLGISPCMLHGMKDAGGVSGLDRRLMDIARADGTPIAALEPWDTVFSLFKGLTPQEELDMIRAALPAAEAADDYAFTTAEAYFRGDIWTIWEYGRQDAYVSSGLDRTQVDAQMRLVEDRLMNDRNTAWITPLTAAADKAAAAGKPVVAAFGALHLPGTKGVLQLLKDQGWTIERLDG